MTDIFISYKQEDRQHAHAIAEMFASHGYDVWWDINLLPGQKFSDEINSVIRKAKATVVLWTPSSILSDWVKAETSLALERGILVPAWLEKVDLPAPYNTLHTIDLTSWDGSPSNPILNGLLAGVHNLVGEPVEDRKALSKADISVVLEKPAYEAEFWSTIAGKQPQSIREYRAYLKKYGDDGSFSELARIRIKELEEEETAKKPASYKAILTSSGIAVGIVVGLFQIANSLGWISDNTEPLKAKVPETSSNQNAIKRQSDAQAMATTPEVHPTSRDLDREIRFRINQIDEVLKKAQNSLTKCTKQIENSDHVLGSCVRDYFTAAQGITVAFELGGIYRNPGKEDDTVWISSSGFGLRHLPERQGYKSKKYVEKNIGDLFEDYYQKSGAKILAKRLNELKKVAVFTNIDILEDWFKRHQASGEYKAKYGSAYNVYKTEMDDYDNQLKRMKEWQEKVVFEWQNFKELFLYSNAIVRDVSQSNSTPVARRDHVATDTLTPIEGNLFSAGYQGADYDPDDDAFRVYSVNGSTKYVDKKIILESGSSIVLKENGDFHFDPRVGFKFLTKTGSSSADRVTYSIIDDQGATSPEVLSIFSVKKE